MKESKGNGKFKYNPNEDKQFCVGISGRNNQSDKKANMKCSDDLQMQQYNLGHEGQLGTSTSG